MDWIFKNKEWLFSGLGLAAAIGVWRLVRFILSRPRAATHTEPIPTPAITHPTVSPEGRSFGLDLTFKDIFSEITSRPPYQRDEARNVYVGANFRLDGILGSVRRQGGDEVRVSIRSQGEYRSAAWCLVSVSQYPELKLIHEGTRIIVQGRITGVDERLNSVDLEAVTLQFP